jgi:hypothetical protein
MGQLGPLLMYMLFGLPNSAIEWILRFPIALVERGVEARTRGQKSAAEGQKPAGIGW